MESDKGSLIKLSPNNTKDGKDPHQSARFTVPHKLLNFLGMEVGDFLFVQKVNDVLSRDIFEFSVVKATGDKGAFFIFKFKEKDVK